MPRRPSAILGTLAATILLLTSLPLGSVAATSSIRLLQADGDSYESPEFGYVVEWTGDWAARERDFDSDPDTGDRMILSNNSGRVQIVGVESGQSPSAAIESAIAGLTANTDVIEVIALNDTADVPSREVRFGQQHALVEIHEVNDATVAVALLAREPRWETALSLAQSGITLNGTAIFNGTPAEGSIPPFEEEPADEPGPEPDEPEASPAADVPGETWTSDAYGFAVEIPGGWTIESEDTGANEHLTLSNGTSLITLRGTAIDNDDLNECVAQAGLDFAETDGVENFSVSRTARGDRFAGSDARGAFALFDYEDETGSEWSYYVHCSSIEEGETALVVTQQVPTADYSDERSARRAIERAVTLP